LAGRILALLDRRAAKENDSVALGAARFGRIDEWH
jgi:hypothetical protein